MGLCVRFGWLPSQAEEEDWATLAQLQKRLVTDDKEAEFENWQKNVKASWKN